MNAKELADASIPEPRWAVDGLIPEGATILAGAPKAQKSFWAIDAALAVASGCDALYGIPTVEGDVLYVYLEGSRHSLQQRVRAWSTAHDMAPSPRCEFVFEWPPASERGIEELEEWLLDFPSMRLVIIDTLAKIMPVASTYNAAYPALARLSELGQRRHCGILVIHHMYRTGSASRPWQERIQGSIGAQAAADALIGLVKSEGRVLMMTTGKDVQDATYTLRYEDGLWLSETTANEAPSPNDREALIAAVADHPGASAPEIATAVGRPYADVRQQLFQMVRAGQLVRPRRGRFFVPGVHVVAR